VAQVRFTEWTSDGKLRHPAFQGLRADKTPQECVREIAAKEQSRTTSKSISQPEAISISLSNPQRLLYPEDGITKQDVADYYQAVSAPLLHALNDRPLAVVHWNQGIDKSRWFHQNTGDDAPPWATVVDTPAKTKRGHARHLVADRPETLRWLAQRSALELHMWHSRVNSLTQPDWVVFDLDPAEGRGIDQAIEVAQILHGMFERLGLPSVPKTSGKRGLHVFVPLAAGHTYDDAQSFALEVGETLAKQLKQITLERSLSKRKGRLYFDCLQNGYGKTVIAPYSLRGIAGAPASAPLKWAEIEPGLDPTRFNLRTMPKRLKKVGDLFAPALTQGIRLPRYKR
jgi:bifunctional non-homologous end joining protein LigD